MTDIPSHFEDEAPSYRNFKENLPAALIGRSWMIDRRIPIVLIVTLFLQTGAAFWWASAVNSRVQQLEERTVAIATLVERMVRVEVRLDNVMDKLVEIRALASQNPVIVNQPNKR
jgi:hypothetical protein